MDVGQALVNERTFDLSVHAGVCVCVLHVLYFVTRKLGGGGGLGDIVHLSLHFAS